MLDFAFCQAALGSVTGRPEFGTWDRWTGGDAFYAGGYDTAITLPTFVSDHDAGRIGHHVRKALPNASDAEVPARVSCAHAMLRAAAPGSVAVSLPPFGHAVCAAEHAQ